MKTKILLFFVLIAGISNLYAQNVPSYVPTNGLIGWWPFNGNANDESGKSHNGTVTGVTLTTDRNGISNKAYEFKSNVDSYIITNYIDSTASNFSYSVWVNTDSTHVLPSENKLSTVVDFDTKQCIIHPVHGGVFGDPSNHVGSGLYVGKNGVFLIEHSDNFIYVPLSKAINLTGWHLITIVYSDNTPSLYVDDKFISTGTKGTRTVHPSLGYDTHPFYKNNSGFGKGFNRPNFIGKMDDIAIYKRSLSQQEITALYSGSSLLSIGSQNLSAGFSNTSVVCSNGNVVTWGDNTNGQLGNNTLTSSSTPISLNAINDVKMIVNGNRFFQIALKNDGTVWSWGNNTYGELGLGNNSITKIPTQIVSLSNIVSISAGNENTFALKSDGTVYAWGHNNLGQLGLGDNNDRNTPTLIPNLINVKSISAGDFHTLFLKNDSTVWACGQGTVGELGNGINNSSNIPLQVSNLSNVKMIKAGFAHSIILKNDGTVWTWGYNNSGQLGNGNSTNSNIPIIVNNISNVVDVKTGDGHCVVLKSDGTVWNWGLGNWGILGNNTTSNSFVPVQVQGLTNTQEIFAGPYHSIAKKQDGTYWAWGRNEVSQLGDGTTSHRLIPVQINVSCSNLSNTLSSTKVYVDAPASVKQNDTLQLAISTETLNTVDNVISYQTDFTYDTTRYTYLSNNLVGTLNPSGNVIVNSTKNGKLTISYMSQTALTSTGSLLNLKFKANNTIGQGIFGLSNFLFNTTAITNLKSDTVTTIDGVPPTAKITYSANPVRKGDSLLITVNFNEKMAVSPVPQLNLSGQNTLTNTNLTKVNDTTYTYWWVVEKGNGAVNVNLATGKDLSGNVIVALPTQNPSFTVLPTFFGDIDTNTLVQAYDAALALQYSVGLNPLPTMDPLPWSNWRLAVANVDTVGNVTANDASLILQHSAKLISTFPADAKKRGGDAPVANVTVSQEGNQLVFRATGTLYAFNVFMKDHFNALGQPEVKDKNAITAANINASTYNVGIASTTPFTENEPFLVIPVLTTETLQGSMDIVANTQEKALEYGAAAGITSLNKESMVVYPNPTKDVVTINNAQGNTLRIVDVQGKEVYNGLITTAKTEISLKSLGAKGMYVLHILDANNVSIQSKQIVLE